MYSDRAPIVSSENGDVQIEKENREKTRCTLITVVSAVVLLLIVSSGLTVYFVLTQNTDSDQISESNSTGPTCSDQCIFSLVESIPDNLTFPEGAPSHPSTYDSIMELLAMATERVEIASFYWTMQGTDTPDGDNSSWQGESILKTLAKTGYDRNIKIKIAQNLPDKEPSPDIAYLQKYGKAEVHTLNFTRLLGSGILHTKMWLIDRKHFYVGSANMDWRSFTQVKELGAVVYNCSCMAEDMGKLFDAYWYLGTADAKIPEKWDPSYSTGVNINTSMQIQYNQTNATSYLSSSPPPFCASGRTVDIDAIVDIINSAEKFVYIAVMDYFPTTQFTKPRIYWPVIDDALRQAAFDRKVEVSLLISHWNNSWHEMTNYLKSLADLKFPNLTNINIRIFVVPAFTEAQKKIPFGRVNHNKYMVTDKTAYIGTSNWSGDYFIDTGGIGLIVNQERNVPLNHGNGQIRQQLEDIFLRDWNSTFSTDIWKFNFTSIDSHKHTEL